MSSNSQHMTLEERLVQRIKTTELAALIDDEDAMATLVKRAVQEALFQPRKVSVGSGYHERTETQDSPVVAAARSIAKEAVTHLVIEELDRLKADPKAMEAIRGAISLLMPAVLLDAARDLANTGAYAGALNAIDLLKNAGVLNSDAVLDVPPPPEALRGMRRSY